jgi:hypothetical protein
MGGLDEGAMLVARAEDPQRARAEVMQILDALIGGLRPAGAEGTPLD